jgi:hypothetical protein
VNTIPGVKLQPVAGETCGSEVFTSLSSMIVVFSAGFIDVDLLESIGDSDSSREDDFAVEVVVVFVEDDVESEDVFTLSTIDNSHSRECMRKFTHRG